MTMWDLRASPHLWLSGKEPPSNAGDLAGAVGLIPGLGRPSGEDEMATHSSILAWIFSWTEEPDGQQFIESKRVGHNLATKQCGILVPGQGIEPTPAALEGGVLITGSPGKSPASTYL